MVNKENIPTLQKEETTVQKFKKVMIEMYKGYPDYIYWGLF